MKRIISMLTVIAIAISVMSLAGCEFGEKLTAYNLYSRAGRTLKEAGGFDADVETRLKFDLMGEVTEQVTTMNMKINGNDGQITMSVEDGGDVIVTTIGNDVYMYVSATGEKVRYTRDTEEDVQKSEELKEVIPDLTEEVFEGISVTELEDGTTSIVFPISSETFNSISEIAGLNSISQLEDSGVSVSFSDITMSMAFDKNRDLTDMTMNADMTFEILGISFTGEMSANYVFKNIGEAPEIVAPEDADSYEYAGEYEE